MIGFWWKRLPASQSRRLRPFGTIQRMPNTTNYKFGDVVLVPFPFTDQTTTKKRPAVVVSSNQYSNDRPDLILMAITSQLSGYYRIGEVVVTDWKAAALLKASMTKPILATVQKSLIIRTLGQLSLGDRSAIMDALRLILGN